MRDMVPRSRLVAVENELEAAEEKNKRVVVLLQPKSII